MYKIETEAKGLVSHGVNACAGCGLELVFRNVVQTLGEDTVVIIPPGCAALFSGIDNVTNMKIAGYQCNLENTAASAAGVRAGLDAQGNTHTSTGLCRRRRYRRYWSSVAVGNHGARRPGALCLL